MSTQKQYKTASKLFFALTFILSCLTMNTDHLKGYMGSQDTVFIFFRYAMIITFVFIATTFNIDNLKFISKFEPISVCIITGILIFDYYVTHISGSQFLFSVWWMAAIFIAEGTLFLTITMLKTDEEEYKAFCRRFWIGFTPLYIFILILCFARTPNAGNLTTNFTFGQGTFLMLKAFINNINGTFEAPLIFFGNLVIFAPLPFIINAFIKKIKAPTIIIIGTIIPFFIEGYQYVFKCGNVDIDDVVLNLAGFYIGYILMIVINKSKRMQTN